MIFPSTQTLFAKKVNMRPTEVVNQIYHPEFGIVFTNGDTWRSQRKTYVRLLKKSGFQKSHLKSVIDYIWPKMMEAMIKTPSIIMGLSEQPTVYSEQSANKNCALEKIELALMELLTLTFADKALFPGGNVPQEYLESFNTYHTCGVQWIDANALWYRYPILRHLAPGLSGFLWIKDVIAETDKNLNSIVSLHKRKDESYEEYSRTSTQVPPSMAKSDASYIDLYLEEIYRTVEDDAKCNLHKALIASLKNCLAGGDGIIMGLFALLYCLARNPQVQEEMRIEIRAETETLPYCRAVILETLRYIPVGGIGPQHYSDQDLLVDGYKIPAGTDVYPNIMGISQSEEHWDQPEVFNPRRFFGPDEKVGVHPKAWIPFSIGDRVCPAKSFSLDMLLMLGLKIVPALELSFEGFVDEAVEGELKYYGMSLVHVHPFKMGVKELAPNDLESAIWTQKSTRKKSLGMSALSADDVPGHLTE